MNSNAFRSVFLNVSIGLSLLVTVACAKAVDHAKAKAQGDSHRTAFSDTADDRARETARLKKIITDASDLSEEASSKRVAAIGKLAKEEKDRTAVPWLLDLAKNDPDTFVRFRAAEALYELGDRRGFEPMLRLLQDPGGPRGSAIRVFVQHQESRAIPYLIAGLNTWRHKEDLLLRMTIAEALGKLGAKGAVEPLIKALEQDPGNYEAAAALGKLRDRQALKPLRRAFEEKQDPLVKIAAAWALIALGEPRYIDYLIERVNIVATAPARSILVSEPYRRFIDNPEFNRWLEEGKIRETDWQAIKYLGLTLDTRALEPLVRCLKSDNIPTVVQEAAKALARLRDKRAVKPLIEAANRINTGPGYNPAMTLARALVLFDHPEAQAAFDKLVPNEQQRQEIREAVKNQGYQGAFPGEE